MESLQNTELRIGNLLLHDTETVLVWGINELDLTVVSGFPEAYISSYEDMKPIKLTEEWLINFGFDVDRVDEVVYYKKFLQMRLVASGKSWFAAPFGYPLHGERTIFVHQLQNLYFALTGEELTIKP